MNFKRLEKLLARPQAPVLTDQQLYEFDLRGFITIKNFLSQELVDEMNAVIDQQLNGLTPKKFPFFEWSPLFMDLAAHPVILKICEHLLGEWFRLDHVMGVQAAPTKHVPPAKDGELHAGPYENQRSFSYNWFDGRSYLGLLTFSIPLFSTRVGQGGLTLLPGSHKQNFKKRGAQVWQELKEDPEKKELLLYTPDLDAGDLLFFTEACIHGSTPWMSENAWRRNLYYKYCPGNMAWRKHEEIRKYLPLARNDVERRLLEPPFVGGYDENPNNIKEGEEWPNQWRKTTLEGV